MFLVKDCHFINLFGWKNIVVFHNKDKIHGVELCQANVKLGYPASLCLLTKLSKQVWLIFVTYYLRNKLFWV
jgi:hypothetical protein